MGLPPITMNEGPNADPSGSSPRYIGTSLAEQRTKHGGDGGGGGEGPLAGFAVRVEHLETRMSRVEGKLDTIIDRLGAVATKSEMRNIALTSAAVFIALIAVFVTAMGWLETRATRSDPSSAQPIVVQLQSPITNPPSVATPVPREAARH